MHPVVDICHIIYATIINKTIINFICTSRIAYGCEPLVALPASIHASTGACNNVDIHKKF